MKFVVTGKFTTPDKEVTAAIQHLDPDDVVIRLSNVLEADPKMANQAAQRAEQQAKREAEIDRLTRQAGIKQDQLSRYLSFAIGSARGARSAPPTCGDYEDGPLAGKVPGYYSRIRVNGKAGATNCCNTPMQIVLSGQQVVNFNNFGGAIALSLKNLPSGEYLVEGWIKATAKVNLKTPQLPRFIVYKANSLIIGWQTVWQPSKWKLAGGGGPTTTTDATYYRIELRVKDGASQSILLVPSFSFKGPESEYMEVDSSISVESIRKVRD